MEKFIHEYLKKEDFDGVEIEIGNPTLLLNIYTLYHDNTFEYINNKITHLYYGIYYQIHKKYDEMKKYYLMAISEKCCVSMYNLGDYYQIINKNYDKMKKYYLMAIEMGSSFAMNDLAVHYEEQEKNIKLAKKYYKMAVSHKNVMGLYNLGSLYYSLNRIDLMKIYFRKASKRGSVCAMVELGMYYKENNKYNKAKLYFLMAIDKGDHSAMYELGVFYHTNEKKYDLMEKYLLMAIDRGSAKAITFLEDYYSEYEKYDQLVELYLRFNKHVKILSIIDLHLNGKIKHNLTNGKILELIQKIDVPVSDQPPYYNIIKNLLNEKIDLMELHFQYSQNGKGFEEAKQDFYEKMNF